MAKITELLHAPDLDLVELDACVQRLGQCAKLIDAAPDVGLGNAATSGVAPSRVLDALPGLPLLHHRTILNGRVSGMTAEVSWTLGTTDARSVAVATLMATCEPALGRIVIEEIVRRDLSNAPAPGDKDARTRILGSILRLQRIVREAAETIRNGLVGGDPVSAAGQAAAAAETIASPYASVALDESPEDDPVEDITLVTGIPYAPASLTYKEQDWDEEELPMLTDEAAASLDAALPRIVGLSVERTGSRITYRFGPTRLPVGVHSRSEDPILELRRQRDLHQVPRPAWRARPADEE